MLEPEREDKEIAALKWANKFLSYIEFRKQGLKKQAQSELKGFFADFSSQNKPTRRNFIDLICSKAFMTKEFDIYLPYNLYNDIFLPEIEDWIFEEPFNSIPYKWSNDRENNKKALNLNPYDQIAIERFGNHIIGKVSMNQHELNNGFPYDGNPDEDISLIDSFVEFVANIKDIDKRNKIYRELSELKQCAEEYKQLRRYK